MGLYSLKIPTGIWQKFVSIGTSRFCSTHQVKIISKKIHLHKLRAAPENKTQGPLCIILGWGNSKQRHLEKYREIYERKGFNSITVSPLLIDALVLPQTRAKKISYLILETIRKEFPDREVPVVFHQFSNAGCAMFYFMCEELCKEESIYSRKINVIGSIFDSCPVVPDFDSITIAQRAFTSEIKSPFLKNAVWYSLRFLLPFVIWLNPIVKLFMTGLENSRIQAPQMFLYSKSDNLAPYQDISKFLEVRKERGISVTAKLWENSPHIRHLMHDPEGYVKIVNEFIDKLQIKS